MAAPPVSSNLEFCSPEAEGLAVDAPEALVGALFHGVDVLVVAVGVVLVSPLHARETL